MLTATLSVAECTVKVRYLSFKLCFPEAEDTTRVQVMTGSTKNLHVAPGTQMSSTLAALLLQSHCRISYEESERLNCQCDCSSAITEGFPAGVSEESDMPPEVGSAGQIQKRNPSKKGWA